MVDNTDIHKENQYINKENNEQVTNKRASEEKDNESQKNEVKIEVEEEKEKNDKELKEPISIKRLTNLIIERIRKLNRRNMKKQTDGGKKSWFEYLINIILIASSIAIVAYMIYAIYITRKQSKVMPGADPRAIPSKLDFEIVQADCFGDIEYIGKGNILQAIIEKLMLIDHVIETKDKEFIANIVKNVSRNFILYGPSGTGKTLFVKKLAYEFARSLKKRNFIKQKGIRRKFDDIDKKPEFIQEYTSYPCEVEITFIDATSVLSKFVGESEKGLKKVFDWARNSQDNKYRIIFVDEIDTFMGGDRSDATEHGLSIRNLLLALLDGGNIDVKKSKVIFIGSTNRFDKIGPEYKRRFNGAYFFDLPNFDERMHLISEALKHIPNAQYKKEDLERFATLTNKKSQAYIMKVFSDLVCNMSIYKYIVQTEDIVALLKCKEEEYDATLRRNLPKSTFYRGL